MKNTIIFILMLCFAFATFNSKAATVVRCTGKLDKVLVVKSTKKLTLLDTSGCIIKQYNIVTGLNQGPKQCEGDKKTPEGIYHITEKRDSIYHRFLAIDYPQAKDIKRAKELGCNPGNAIGIHGWFEGLDENSSLGCIRVKETSQLLEIDRMVKKGTVVEIRK